MSAGAQDELRRRAEVLDQRDRLAFAVDRFGPPSPGPSGEPLRYLDGHSLGPPPAGAAEAVEVELDRWRQRLIGGWNERWLDLGREAAALLAPVLGAAAEEVWVGDSTSINLAKVVQAILARRPDRPDIVTDAGNFPTDRYLLDGAARCSGGRLRTVAQPTAAAVQAALDDRVGLVSLSAVDFRSGARADVRAITAAAQRAGAACVWDASHAAGVVPLDLAGLGADAAVGCSYKYLNGGPGAPAWLYVRGDLVPELENPLPGWFGHARPFDFDRRYQPAPGIGRFAVGTPAVLSLAGALPGLALAAQAGVAALAAKAADLTQLVIDAAGASLTPLGFEVLTPPRPEHRGGHVGLRHPDAWAVTQLGVRELGVVGDFREPDVLRLGCSPLPLRHVDVVDAVARLAAGVASGRHRAHRARAPGVP